MTGDSAIDGAWIRYWQHRAGGWASRPWPTHPVRSDPSTFVVRVPVRPRPHAAQICGDDRVSRFVMLPWDTEAEIVLQPVEGHASRLAVSVSSGDLVADMAHDRLRLGRTDRPITADTSYAARIACGHQRIRSAAPADRLPADEAGTADEAVIAAWEWLRAAESSPDEPGPYVADARRWLLAASSYGVPCYHESLVLLARGLRTLPAAGDLGDDVGAAYDRVGRYLAAADPAGAVAMFRGDAPDRPTHEPATPSERYALRLRPLSTTGIGDDIAEDVFEVLGELGNCRLDGPLWIGGGAALIEAVSITRGAAAANTPLRGGFMSDIDSSSYLVEARPSR